MQSTDSETTKSEYSFFYCTVIFLISAHSYKRRSLKNMHEIIT